MNDPSSTGDPSVAQQEIDAFFAQPRKTLYLGAALFVLALLGAVALCLVLAERGLGIFGLPVFGALLWGAVERASRGPAGRGLLRTLGFSAAGGLRKLEPRTQVLIARALFLASLALAAVF